MSFEKPKTLYTISDNHIGQVKAENAQTEIERLNKMFNTDKWRTDNSEFLYELDDEEPFHIKLSEGYVWVTCEN